jgi:hypothetical protein
MMDFILEWEQELYSQKSAFEKQDNGGAEKMGYRCITFESEG